MARIELHLAKHSRASIDKIVEGASDELFWWEFEYDDQTITRPSSEEGNIYLQMGMTFGAKGRIYICGNDESALIHFRLRFGI